MSQSFEHIILSRPDRIGDIVVSTACIAPIRQRFPQARITMLVDQSLTPLLEGHPLLDAVVGASLSSKVDAYRCLDRLFEAAGRSILVELNSHPWVSGVAQKYPSLSVRRYRSGFFDFSSAPVDRRGQGRTHEALANWDLLDGLGVGVPEVLRASLPNYEDAWTPLASANPGLRHEPFAVFHLGAHGGKRSWPVAKFVQVAEALAKSRGWRPVLVGIEGDLSQSFLSLYQGKLQPMDLSGKTSLRALGALLSRGELIISRDSGPAHLGAAVGCPTVALMSAHPKHCARRWAPLGERVAVVEQPLFRKALWESRDAWWERVFSAIQVEDVMHAVERVSPR